jgi:hypothetical protein
MSKLGSDKTVLLVCRGLGEIKVLRRLRPQPGCHYIVASDDLRVHLEMKTYPWVAEVCYLERMESFYAVAFDVIKYLELINQWLESLGSQAKGIPQELLFWIRHCEGGKTTQRLQDLLLLIRSYEHLIDTYSISSIIILSHPQTEWEDDVLIKVGQQKGVKVQTIGNFRLNILKAKLLSLLKLLAREPYYIFPILRDKLWEHFRPQKPGISVKEIVMQMCIPHDKFIEEHILVMQAFKSLGYDPVALLWRASKAAVRFQQAELRAEKLETFVPMSSIWGAPFRVWLTWRQARRRRYEFLAHPGLEYRNIPFGPLLWPCLRSFFWEELAQRYRLQQAAKQYFLSHSPLAVRLWGGEILAEGFIVSKSLNDRQRPLTFLWFGAAVEDPYYQLSSTDLFLAAGDNEKEYLEKLGVPANRIVTVGSSRYDNLAAFRKEHSPSQSRAFLKIPQDFQNYILFDSNEDSRGYLTIQEQSLVTNALCNFAQQHPSVALMIKPHPVHRPGWLEALIGYFSLPNVFLVDKKMLPYHALNAADLLITKLSTLALEAMLFERPVISVLLDGEERFRIYGEAVERANSLEDLTAILTMLVSDAGRRAEWVETQLNNQKKYLQNYLGKNIVESAKLGAAAVGDFLTHKFSGTKLTLKAGILACR